MADSSITLDLAFGVELDPLPDLPGLDAAWLDGSAGAEQTWHQLLLGWLEALAAELPPRLRTSAYSLGLSLVDDAGIAALNADWRGRPTATDVLAFAAQDDGPADAPPMPLPCGLADDDDPEAAEPLELGDIVISLDTAARQAPDHGHSLERELLFLASHGLLHLLGWDHPDDASLNAMLARQEQLLAGVPSAAPL